MPTEVVNLKDGDEIAALKKEGRFVFVGRPSVWGNPYSHLPETPKAYRVPSKEEAIARYETWLKGQPALIDRAKRELLGKALACWCVRDPDGSKPVVCHAQVLANLVREFEEERVAQAVVDSTYGYDPREHGAKCDVCPLKGRHRPVPPSFAAGGPAATKLIIVGEGPGRVEIVDGKPFRGPSGLMVNKLLAQAGLPRSDCHVTNAAACRGDTDWEKERAAACCGERLAKELAQLPIGAPVLALGAPAAKVMLGRGSILRTRGFVWRLAEVEPSKIRAAERSLEKRKKLGFAAAIDRSEQSLWRLQARAQFNGRVIIPSIHPAFVLRGGEAMLPMLKVDMKRAVRWALKGPLKLYDEGEYKVARNKTELIKLLKTLRTQELLIDVETNGPEALISPMTMFGISEVPGTGAVGLEAEAQLAKNPKFVTPDTVRVVLVSPNIDASTQAGAERLRKTLCEMGAVVHEFIESKGHVVGGHNFASFDMLVLERYGIKPTRVFDSLIAHHAVASHMRQGLDHLATMYTDTGPWKIAFKTKGAEEKGGVQTKWMSSEDLDKYNCLRGSTRVVLADGSRKRLQDIVWHRESPLVMSMNAAGEIEPRRVIGWHQTRVVGQAWIGIRVAARGAHNVPSIVCTPDHKVYTDRGWVMAQDVCVGDRLAQVETTLSDDERGALLGTLLGDSSMAFSPINRGRRASARTAAVYGTNVDYSELAQHKCRVMSWMFSLADKAAPAAGSSYPNASPTRRYAASMCCEIAELRPLVYDRRGRKRLFATTLDLLGPIGLAWWFMDDGCLQKGGQNHHYTGTRGGRAREPDGIAIATNCFPRKDVRAAVEWFKIHYGPTWVGRDNVIRIGHKAAVAFCRQIAPHVPQGMRYKFPRDVTYPKYTGAIRRGTRPRFSRVVAVGPHVTRRDSAVHRFNADNRFCLTVEGNNNFFTTGGLVHNCADVRLNAIAWRRMQPDLGPEQKVYKGDMAVAEVCRSMMRAGFQFDDKLAEELSGQLKARAGALLGQMRTLLGKRDFHPARPSDVREALFGKLQIRPTVITNTGLASTASGPLEAIKNPETVAGKLASLILRWRATQKTRATFIEGVRPYSDGRIHPGWKAFGTVSGRLSCSRPNIMNLPRWSRSLEDRVRELYVAGPGCELVYFDLSQSEMRMAAYASNDENFIASCESGDVHSSNAKILFPDAREVLDRDPKGKKCPRHGESGSAKAECACGVPFRSVAKNAGFGVLYQADSETIFKFLLSKGFDVTLRDVEAMFNEIHKVYARYYQFCDENMMFCKQHGHLRAIFSGRVRWLGWFPSITDVANYKIQSGIADLMNDRIVRIAQRLPRGARLVAQVHDALIIEAKRGRVANDTEKLVRELWDEPIVMPHTDRSWKMPIDLKRGARWSDFG